MKQYIDILTKILEASHDGFDIILSELPQTEVCRANPKKKFKLRNEQDASACLYRIATTGRFMILVVQRVSVN